MIGSLQVSSDGWMVNVLVTDHTARDLFCNVDNDALERLLGFSFKECKVSPVSHFRWSYLSVRLISNTDVVGSNIGMV